MSAPVTSRSNRRFLDASAIPGSTLREAMGEDGILKNHRLRLRSEGCSSWMVCSQLPLRERSLLRERGYIRANDSKLFKEHGDHIHYHRWKNRIMDPRR